MQRPDVYGCPVCQTPVGLLEARQRVQERDDGSVRYAGSYHGCECGALTRCQATGELNLRNDVAEAYAVTRKTDASVAERVRPVVRRKAVVA